ncbi:hypothetical protein HanRHA438_Chr05g0237031 [Helianthus annuus]|uniref:Uncharacterized protein n=1 Tax=Helianthus annuus TaxID=4232 RepID=A0A9K3J165_HELAN|nr:hypothetical protein HanXRQr2_Chr05g0227881 [Helianthus annuus]KAJ0920089.1 hypothetical protein HanRHA438_Chr05g0237031 [Helianthus annuus]KAJ0923765.1 hypothetical protein HanPSC8_Chr05g0219891 [Helianthus annuus]
MVQVLKVSYTRMHVEHLSLQSKDKLSLQNKVVDFTYRAHGLHMFALKWVIIKPGPGRVELTCLDLFCRFLEFYK